MSGYTVSLGLHYPHTMRTLFHQLYGLSGHLEKKVYIVHVLGTALLSYPHAAFTQSSATLDAIQVIQSYFVCFL